MRDHQEANWEETFHFPERNDRAATRRCVISIVTPAFNEELNLTEFYRQVSAQLEGLGVSWEIVIVDDGSSDHSTAILDRLHKTDPRVKAIRFARNFGNQIAVSAGLAASTGEAVIIMDADLQHPVELIPQLFAEWKKGYPIVNTVRRYGNKTKWSRKMTSSLFYKVMNLLSGTRIEPSAPDFKLLDRRVVDLLNQMPERTRYLKALIPWLGFRQTAIPFDCKERYAGETSFTFFKLVELAIDGLISFTTKPLRWIIYLGMTVLGLTIPYGAWAVFQFIFLGPKTPGWTSIILLNLLIGGTTLISLGIIGEYIGRIYNEVKRRPLYTVEKVWGLDDQKVTEASFGKDLTDESPSFAAGRRYGKRRQKVA